jgi:hypothetical protein
VNYGHDSQGPQREITEMLINAVKITDPWYESERQKLYRTTPGDDTLTSPIAHSPNNKKRWWRIW